ncbi:MAG: DNA polymerase III subunit gamma/tau [Defluviitaleaceae bacterium]|nr:DNA polymerase III subunit gamma/tau [Defluviitaleaceae bacterium]
MHTALYRKKRPKTFTDLVGQPHVVQALQNQLETGQLSHAYLFCGTRGTGKTTAAKIFARAVNCMAKNQGEPCNICEICQSILAERSMDVIEIDAASNNSVDNIRDLREEVRYPPTHATHKVYIIDEVHMLSTSAFNALLKTLEEPPSHVIFILATTDPQKIPATILSRCQRYDFKRITATDMVATMARYLQAENTPYEEAALGQIAYHSDGAMRDALSLLDQSLAMGEDTGVTLANALGLLGAVDRQVLFAFTEALATYESAKILAIIDGAMTEGRDVTQLTNDLIRHFRDVLVAGQGAALDYSQEIKDKLIEQSKNLPGPKLVEYIRAFSETLRELRFAPHMRTALEVCALRLCSPVMTTQGSSTQTNSGELEGLITRISKLEKQISEITTGSQQKEPQFIPPAPAKETEMIREIQPPPQEETTPTQEVRSGALTPQLLSEIQSNWRALCNALPPMLRSMLIRCSTEANGGTLEIICDNEAEAKILKDKNRPLAIRETLAERFNLSTPPNLAFIVRETYNKEAPKTQPAKAPTQEPPPAASPPPHHPQEPEQMGWDDYAQGVDGGDAPF